MNFAARANHVSLDYNLRKQSKFFVLCLEECVVNSSLQERLQLLIMSIAIEYGSVTLKRARLVEAIHLLEHAQIAPIDRVGEH